MSFAPKSIYVENKVCHLSFNMYLVFCMDVSFVNLKCCSGIEK